MTGRPEADSIPAILLAAGVSERFEGETPKQLVEVEGEPMVRRIARRLLESRLGEVIVVTGFEVAAIGEVLRDLPLRLVHNPAFRQGQSTSVVVGLQALSSEAEAACFVPCDQPLLDVATLNLLAEARRDEDQVVVPVHAGKRGAPVIFPRSFFADLSALSGDEGGRRLFGGASILEVELESADPLFDVDTKEDLRQMQARL